MTFSVSTAAALSALSCAILTAIIALRLHIIDTLMIPLVALSQSFPLQAITPLILIIMGTGFFTKLIIAFIISFFPIYSACITAMKTTPNHILYFSKIYNAGFIMEVVYIRIPYALPAIISSAKVGFTLSVLGAVIAEFIQPSEGLGRIILLAQSQYQINNLYICIILLMIQGITVYVSLSKLERFFIKKGGYGNA
jgi:NitT/TauT family transport system permease protein